MPDEILQLDRRQCIALFQGRKPALLYKLAPEELPGYDTLTSCRVADYTPEWRQKTEPEQVQRPDKETPAPPNQGAQKAEPQQAQPQPDPMDEPNPTKDLDYEIGDTKGLGMVELKAGDLLGWDLEDGEIPPGR